MASDMIQYTFQSLPIFSQVMVPFSGRIRSLFQSLSYTHVRHTAVTNIKISPFQALNSSSEDLKVMTLSDELGRIEAKGRTGLIRWVQLKISCQRSMIGGAIIDGGGGWSFDS